MEVILHRVPETKLFINVSPSDGPRWVNTATFCFYHGPDTQDEFITVERSQSTQGTYAFLPPIPDASFLKLESRLAGVVHPSGHRVLWMDRDWEEPTGEIEVVEGLVQRSFTLNLWSFNALSDSSPGKGSLLVNIPKGTLATFRDDHVLLVGPKLEIETRVDTQASRRTPLNQKLILCLRPGSRCATVEGQLSTSDTAEWITLVTPQVRYMWKSNAFPTIISSRILSSDPRDHSNVNAHFLLNSFNANREFTYISLVPGAHPTLKSNLSDKNLNSLILAPSDGAAIYFEQHLRVGHYASLQGKFTLLTAPEALGGDGLSMSREIIPGCTGTEFFQLNKNGYDGLAFFPGKPAFVEFANGDNSAKVMDTITTSWIAPCRTGPGAADTSELYSFVAQPQQEPLYGRRSADVASLTKSPSANSIVFFDPAPTSVQSDVCMPFIPFRGLPRSSIRHAEKLDREALAPERSTLAAEGSVAGFSKLARAPADTRAWVTTPQGLLVEIDANNEWHRIKLAEGSGWEMTIERPKINGTPVERWALQEALTRSDVFVVISRQKQGDIPDTNDPALDAIKLKMEISGWSFMVNLVSTSTDGGGINEEPPPLDSGHAPVLILKLSKGPLATMLGNVGRWALARVLNQSPQTASKGALKALNNLKTLAEGRSPLVDGGAKPQEKRIAPELKAHYRDLYEKITDENWTGVLVLNAHVPFDDVPPQLRVVTEGAEDEAGKNAGEFSVPLLGLDLSRVVPGPKGLELDKTSAFGAIHYHSPKALDETHGDFGFKLRQLNAIFDNSELRTFLASMQLRIGEFFGTKTQPGIERLMDIICRYEGRGVASTEPKYTFRALGEYTIPLIDNDFLQELTVNRVDLTSRPIGEKTVESRFGIWGELEFGPKFIEVTGIKRISYQNAAVVMKTTKAGAGETKSFYGEFGNVHVDIKKNSSASGLLEGFPLQLSGLRWVSMELSQSLNGIGFTQLKLPGFSGLDAPSFDFGLELDLNLGSMGNLFEAADFLKARILVGWYASSRQNKGFSLGFRFEGGNGPLDIGVNGVMRLRAQDVSLQSYRQGIGIGLLHPQLEVMGYKIPAKPDDTLVALLPKGESSVAWAWARLLTDLGPAKLDYFALGQRLELVPADAFEAGAGLKDIIEESRRHMIPGQVDGGAKLPNNIGELYKADAGWGVVAKGEVGSFKFRFVFLDGLNRYGLGVNLPNIADIDVIYRKISDGVGVFSAQIAPQFRTLEMGAATVTLPIVGFDALTNGDWSISIGYHGNDFSRGTTVQLLPFLGSGGIRFGKLDWRSSYVLNSPNSVNGNLIRQLDLDPVIEMSLAARLGIGKEFREGVFYAGLTLSVYGIFEGALGRPKDPEFPTDAPKRYIKLSGTAGLLLEIFGTVNFAIVSAAVSIRAWAEMGLTLESWTPVVVHVEAGVRVFVRFVIARFKIFGKKIEIAINFRFATRVRFTQRLPYAFDGRNPYESLAQRLSNEKQAALLAHECTLPLEWVKHKVADTPAHILAATTIEPTLSGVSPMLLPMLFASDSPIEEGLALFIWHLFQWALQLSRGLTPDEVSLSDLTVLRSRLSPPKGTSLARWGAKPLDFEVLRDFLQDHLRLELADVEALLTAQQSTMRQAGLPEPEKPQGILLPWFADITIHASAGGIAPIVLRDFRSSHSQMIDAAWEHQLFDRLNEAVPDYSPDECEKEKRLMAASGLNPTQTLSKEALDAITEDWAAALLQGIAHQAWEAAHDLLRAQNGNNNVPLDKLKDKNIALDELKRVLLVPGEEGSLAAQTGKHAGTFLHSGLRVPKAASKSAAVPLAEFLRTEIPLTELATSNDWTLFFEPRAGFAYSWITGTSRVVGLQAQDADIHQKNLAARLAQRKIKLTAWLEETDRDKTTQARRFLVDSIIPIGKVGSAPSLHVAEVPPALSALAQRSVEPLQVIPRLEVAGNPQTGDRCQARWFVKIDVQLEHKQGAESNARPLYSVLHVNARIRTLVQQMIKSSMVQKVRLAYLAKGEAPQVPLQFVEKQEAFLFVSNLSMEPNPDRRANLTATTFETPTYAHLGNTEQFAQILWMASTVNAPGFHLAFKNGADPIKHLFEKAAIASVSMVFELKESEFLSPLVDGILLDNALVDGKQVVSFTTPKVMESLTTTPDGQVAVIVERENPLYGLPEKDQEDEVDLRSLSARYELVDYWVNGRDAQMERGNVMPTRVNLDENELATLAGADEPSTLRFRILVPVSKIAARTAKVASGATREVPPNPYELVGVDVANLIGIGLRDGAGHYLEDATLEVEWKGPTRLLYRDAILRLQELAGVDAQWQLKRKGGNAVVKATLKWSAGDLFSTNPKMPLLAEEQRAKTLAEFRRAAHAMAARDFRAELEVSFDGSLKCQADVKRSVQDWLDQVCTQLESREDKNRTCILEIALPATALPVTTPNPVRMDVWVGFYRNPDLCDQRLLDILGERGSTQAEKETNDIARARSPLLPTDLQTPTQWKSWASFVKNAFGGLFSLLRQLDGDINTQAARPIGNSLWLMRREMLNTEKLTARENNFYAPEPLAKSFQSGSVVVCMPDKQKASIEAKDVDLNALAVRATGAMETLVSRAVGEALCQWKPGHYSRLAIAKRNMANAMADWLETIVENGPNVPKKTADKFSNACRADTRSCFAPATLVNVKLTDDLAGDTYLWGQVEVVPPVTQKEEEERTPLLSFSPVRIPLGASGMQGSFDFVVQWDDAGRQPLAAIRGSMKMSPQYVEVTGAEDEYGYVPSAWYEVIWSGELNKDPAEIDVRPADGVDWNIPLPLRIVPPTPTILRHAATGENPSDRANLADFIAEARRWQYGLSLMVPAADQDIAEVIVRFGDAAKEQSLSTNSLFAALVSFSHLEYLIVKVAEDLVTNGTANTDELDRTVKLFEEIATALSVRPLTLVAAELDEADARTIRLRTQRSAHKSGFPVKLSWKVDPPTHQSTVRTRLLRNDNGTEGEGILKPDSGCDVEGWVTYSKSLDTDGAINGIAGLAARHVQLGELDVMVQGRASPSVLARRNAELLGTGVGISTKFIFETPNVRTPDDLVPRLIYRKRFDLSKGAGPQSISQWLYLLRNALFNGSNPERFALDVTARFKLELVKETGAIIDLLSPLPALKSVPGHHQDWVTILADYYLLGIKQLDDIAKNTGELQMNVQLYSVGASESHKPVLSLPQLFLPLAKVTDDARQI